MERSEPAPNPASEPCTEGRLDSWKEIAAYLKRDVRTVHRWEAEEGLPVHRHVHKKRGTVYAYAAELDAWRAGRQPADETEAQTAGNGARQGRPATVILVAAALLVLAGAGYVAREWISGPRSAALGKVTLAVLPFENLSGDPEQEYISDGMTEEMITQLENLHPERLSVIARASAMQYKRSRKDIAQIARELTADYALEGSVRRSSGRVRVTARLIRTRDQIAVWTQSYDREQKDVLALQSDIATAIAGEISIQLSPMQRARLSNPRQIRPEAHEAYLKGLYFFGKFSVTGMQKSIEHLQQAIRMDPAYAPAYARMARAYGLLGIFNAVVPELAHSQMNAAARKSLELDPTLDEAHCALGWDRLFYDRDWDGARQSFQQAIALNPNSPTTHQGFAALLVATGKLEQALQEISQAQKLDPVSLSIKADLGWYLIFARRNEEAIAQLQGVLEMDPDFPVGLVFHAQAVQQKGMFELAVQDLRKAQELFDGNTGVLARLARACALAGRKHEARQILRQLSAMSRDRYVPPYHIALVHVALNEKDAAFQCLERGYRERFWMMVFLQVDPQMDPLRPDPRFADLVQGMGFPP